LAVEKLQKARDEWQENRMKRLDFINQRLKKEAQATKYINDLDIGMRLYYQATKQRLPPLRGEPKLSDFYQPSEGQKTAEVIFVTGGLGALGYVLHRYA